MTTEQARLEWNEDTKTISVGKWETKEPISEAKAMRWAAKVIKANTGVYQTTDGSPKHVNQAIAQALGHSPTKLFKMYQGLEYKQFIAPHTEFLSKLAYSPGYINHGALKKIVAVRPLLDQAKADGQWNIMPFIMELKKNPQELKELFGKKHWKIIANNSLHRNKALVDSPHIARRLMLEEDPVVSNINDRLSIPTTILQKHRVMSALTQEYLKNNFKGRWSEDLVKETQLWLDALRMGVEVNPKWTPRRVKEEHDKMVHILNALKYSPEALESTLSIPVQTLEYEGYVATLLRSPLQIAEEGTAMGHCVAGYTAAVREGEYLVYSITKDGERSSTLGVRAEMSREHIVTYTPLAQRKQPSYRTGWTFSQHYVRFNDPVTDLAEAALGRLVVDKLNHEEMK